MKRQCYLALGRNTELLFLDNCINGTKYMKSKQLKRNECKFIFVKLNTFNTHTKRQLHLALRRQHLEKKLCKLEYVQPEHNETESNKTQTG